ncbi:MAG: hypothetical protein NTV80_13930, partial [Verrucomicrobia bacterium]|nr:hypothetical protein [Verrucomicrobiota bacterium]
MQQFDAPSQGRVPHDSKNHGGHPIRHFCIHGGRNLSSGLSKFILYLYSPTLETIFAGMHARASQLDIML